MKLNELKNKKVPSWIISPAFMSMLMLLVYAIKRIYPFGNVTIAYYDMAQNYIPSFTATWEAFHSNGGLFWDWFIEGGSQGGTGVVINPLSLYYFFTSRDNIVNTLAILLLVKVSIAAFSMTLYIDKKFTSISDGWKIIIGILYASASYILQYYTNIQFLDLVYTIPLLIYTLDKILDGRKSLLFIILMFFDFSNNIQMMFMICIYVVFYSFVFIKEKPGKRKAIINLAISTIIAMMLAAISWAPFVASTVGSYRANESTTVYENNLLYMLVNLYDAQKLFMIYGEEIIIAYIIWNLIKKKIGFAQIKNELIICAFTIVPIFVECINIMWHLGGYIQFPMRYAYLTTFSLLMLFARLLQLTNESKSCMDDKNIVVDENENQEKLHSDKGVKVVKNIITFSIGALGLVGMFYFIWPLHTYGALMATEYEGYWMGLILLVIIYILILYLNPDKGVVYSLVVIQCIMGWYIMIAPTEAGFLQLSSTEYLQNIQNITNEVEMIASDEDARIARVRDDSASLTVNYAPVLHASSLSTRFYSCNANMSYLLQRLGYSGYTDYCIDTGATVFADALFHVRKIISFSGFDDGIYTVVDEKEGYYLKENNIYYPYGILVNENLKQWAKDISIDEFEYQNQLFSDIHNEKLELFSSFGLFSYVVEDNVQLGEDYYGSYFSVPIEGRKALYFNTNVGDTKYLIAVNEQPIIVPDLGETDSYIYPNDFNNGMIYLGFYENEMVNITIASSAQFSDEDVMVATMDLNLLKEKTEEQHKYEREITPTNNGLKYTVNNTDGYNYLLLPIGFQNKFWCKVNGKSVECEPCVEDALTLIPIEEGMNEISLVYIPRGLITGAIISVIGLLVLVLTWKKWDAILEVKWLQNVASVCFTTLFWAIIVCIYILPTIAEIVLRFIWNPFGI